MGLDEVDGIENEILDGVIEEGFVDLGLETSESMTEEVMIDSEVIKRAKEEIKKIGNSIAYLRKFGFIDKYDDKNLFYIYNRALNSVRSEEKKK